MKHGGETSKGHGGVTRKAYGGATSKEHLGGTHREQWNRQEKQVGYMQLIRLEKTRMIHTHHNGKITFYELQTCVARSVIKFDKSGSPSKNSEDHCFNPSPYTRFTRF